MILPPVYNKLSCFGELHDTSLSNNALITWSPLGKVSLGVLWMMVLLSWLHVHRTNKTEYTKVVVV